MEKSSKKWYQIWWVWLIILFVFGKIIGNSKKSSYSNSSSKSSSSSNCIGNQECISNVRLNFTNTGKQILSEQYLGNGIFGISFLDSRRGVAANAKVTTDCNCNVTNVNVSTIR
jgi:hypothetical protein